MLALRARDVAGSGFVKAKEGESMTTYVIRDETGYEFAKIEADSADAALDQVDAPTADLYEMDDGPTIWVRYRAVNMDDRNDDATRTYRVDPREPRCSGGSHDWQSPHAIVGGLRDNPGVHGHEGGIIMRRVCMHCGCERVVDTWAQDRSTGAQGLESVEYAPRKYAREVALMREESEPS